MTARGDFPDFEDGEIEIMRMEKIELSFDADIAANFLKLWNHTLATSSAWFQGTMLLRPTGDRHSRQMPSQIICTF